MGEVSWVKIPEIRFDLMWDGDKYWIPLVLDGKTFDAKLYYDKEDKKIVKYEIDYTKHEF